MNAALSWSELCPACKGYEGEPHRLDDSCDARAALPGPGLVAGPTAEQLRQRADMQKKREREDR